MELLEKIENLRSENELYCLVREDGVVMGVTNNKNKIPQMISEEFCEVEVRIDKVSYVKHDYSYDIEVTLFDDGDENIYDFKLSTVVFYK